MTPYAGVGAARPILPHGLRPAAKSARVAEAKPAKARNSRPHAAHVAAAAAPAPVMASHTARSRRVQLAQAEPQQNGRPIASDAPPAVPLPAQAAGPVPSETRTRVAQASPRPAAPHPAARRTRTVPAAVGATGDIIRNVVVQGNQRIEADTIRSYMLQQPGDAYDPDQVDRSLKSLFATGLFSDVRILHVGSDLIVTVQENPLISRVAFEGNNKITDDVLTKLVQLHAGSVFTPSGAEQDRQRILDLYAHRGRFAATVNPQIIHRSDNRVDLIYEIHEGDTALVARINFVGNHAYSDSRLKDVVSTKEHAWYRIFSSSDAFDPDRVNYDKELLRRFYLRNGYADVKITGSSAELARDRSGFFITYTIDEGPRYKIGKVAVTTTLPHLDPKSVQGTVNIAPGDWYDGDAVDRNAQALQDAVNLKGISFVDVQGRVRREAKGHLIDLTFEIGDAPHVYVDRINIAGNTRTQDRVIRREFRIAEGDAFNAAQVRRSRERIQALGYFSDVQLNPAPSATPDRTTLNTRLTERATGEVSLGGGYSTDYGPLASVGLRERNLLGTGVDARIEGTLAEYSNQVDLGVTDPYFLDRNLAAGFDIFYLTRNLANTYSYYERRAGFSLRAGYALNEHLRQSWSYTLSNRQVYDVQTYASLYIKEQQGTTLMSQISQTLTYDRRDSMMDPHRGYITRLSTDFAGLGGDVAYIRTRVDGAYYIPLERMLGNPDYVLSLSGSVGYLTDLFGKQDRIVDRFFLGGQNLRGFAIGGAGPHDTSTGDSLGGRLMWTQSTELRVPLPLPPELGLSGRIFVDVGALSESEKGANVADDASPRVGAGVGLSWKSPFGLINIDLAQAVVKKSYDETQVFRFGFGTRF